MTTTTTTTTAVFDLIGLTWTKDKEVNTRYGKRLLAKAKPTDEFWDAWRAAKPALKEAGISLSKDSRGNWEICWWKPLSAEQAVADAAAISESRAIDAPQDLDLPVPDGLAYLPYQRAGVAYSLSHNNVLIADEMGLGKTIQAIGVMNADPSIRRVLVVCPASLRLNWQREVEKWATRPVDVRIVNGGKAADWPKGNSRRGSVAVVIVNYDVVAKHAKKIHSSEWDLAVLDEAHYCKNPKAIRTQALLGREANGKLSAKPAVPAKRIVALTGTPIVNRPIELWPMLRVLDPEGLGKSFWTYARQYCNAHRTRFGWDFSGNANLDVLQDHLRRNCMVRRLKSEVLTDLPAKIRQVIELPANGASEVIAHEAQVAAQYEVMLNQLQASVELAKASDDPDDYVRAVEDLRDAARIAFTEMAKERHQVALAKVPYVVSHLKDAIEAGPVVCFAHHKDVIQAIASEFERVATITGSTPMKRRQAIVDQFQAGEIDLLIGNIRAAGVGLTLTRSSHVVFAEGDWTPSALEQAADRCHRIGQRCSVLVQYLVFEGSIDANMAKKVIDKQMVIDAALDNKKEETEEVLAPTRDTATTFTYTVSKLTADAVKITEDQQAAIHSALCIIAGVCDGAHELDGCGFNKIDTRIGKELAYTPAAGFTKRMAALGRRLVHKYRRQVPADLLASAGLDPGK